MNGICLTLDCTPPPITCLFGCTLGTTPHSCFSCICDSCPAVDAGPGPGCNPYTCDLTCCNGYCTDPTWDSMNCGSCGNVCASDEACVFVGEGPGGAPEAACQPAQCVDGGNCCGSETCGVDQVCCNATGDVVPYPPFTCVDLDAGICTPSCECA